MGGICGIIPYHFTIAKTRFTTAGWHGDTLVSDPFQSAKLAVENCCIPGLRARNRHFVVQIDVNRRAHLLQNTGFSRFYDDMI